MLKRKFQKYPVKPLNALRNKTCPKKSEKIAKKPSKLQKKNSKYIEISALVIKWRAQGPRLRKKTLFTSWYQHCEIGSRALGFARPCVKLIKIPAVDFNFFFQLITIFHIVLRTKIFRMSKKKVVFFSGYPSLQSTHPVVKYVIFRYYIMCIIFIQFNCSSKRINNSLIFSRFA